MTMLFGSVLLAAMVTVLPWKGARAYRRVKSGTVPRTRTYRMILLAQASYAGCALVYAALSGRAGEVLPARPLASPTLGGWSYLLPGVMVGAAVGLILPVVVPKLRRRILEKGGDFLALMPRTTAERWLFVPVALSAGIGEELLFRGYAWDFSAHQLGLPTAAAFALVSALFGLAHWYQGVKGIVGTALLGAMFLLVYLITGTLLVPMALHALVDLRVIALSLGTDWAALDGRAT